MPGKRPINADVATSAAKPPVPEQTASSRASEIDHTRVGSISDAKGGRGARGKQRRRRRPIPGALKAIAGLVIVALVFLVAAVLGGGGSNQGSGEQALTPAPTPSGERNEEVETPAAEAAEELGYPSFATNNTTRVGGSDPATTAAAVALAAFPSTTPAQRPAAVTLVDEADWQGAIAASVLMAAPAKAPLLVSADGNLPDPTSQALEALDPQGSDATGKAQAFSIGDAATPDGLRTTEVEPGEPATIAASIAELRDKLFGSSPQHIVLAPEESSAFAMPAAAWAARSGDPILFTGAKKLPAATVAALKRHTQAPVYLLGPSSAISSNVFREVAKIDKRVRRVSGEDPVKNAIALARYADDGFGWNVNDPGHGFVVARSDSPLDAALAAPLSASGTWGPLLLTDDADTLPKTLREYLLDVKPGYTTDPTRAFYNHVWVIGDQEAIDVNQQADINQLAELARIGGEP
ncbi:MAG: cell wall-binding repeat-containing protein [Solirubrobacterales bacterium]